MFRDVELLGGAAFGFEPFGDGAALGFDGVRDFVEADEGKRIAVGIAESGEDAAPNRGMLFGGR